VITSADTPSPDQLDAWVTSARLSPFRAATGDDDDDAIALYVWNARIAGACIEVIHHVEVLVRNAFHRQLTAGQPAAGLRSWLIDPDVLRAAELSAVEAAVGRVRRLRKPVTEDRVVASLPLSFWARLVGTAYSELWVSTLHRALPHGSGSRRDVAGQANRVAQLRNDIAHHKALLHVPLAERHRDLLALAAAVDPAASTWIGGISQVDALLARSPR
jgi:hypothetical protein